MNDLKVVSLFSGGGLMDVGFIRAGYKIIWANDFDANAVKAYKTNIGEHIVLGDVSKVKMKDVPACDIVIGGFPCQPFSFSGENQGVEDTQGRGTMAYQFYRFIKNKKPLAFVAENVKGLASKTHNDFLEAIVNNLRELGYNVGYKTLHAADYGVAQKRERIFIVGIRNDLRKSFDFSNIPTEKKNYLLDILNENELRQLSNHSNTFKIFTKDAVYGGLKRGGKGGTFGLRIQEWNDVSDTLRSHIAKDGIDFIHPSCGLTMKVLQYIYKQKEMGNLQDLSLAAEEIVNNFNPRRLSVRECLRIQSVPDSYFFIDDSVPDLKKKHPELAVPVTAQFKIVGNGVPSLLAEKLAVELKMCLSRSLQIEDLEIEHSKKQAIS